MDVLEQIQIAVDQRCEAARKDERIKVARYLRRHISKAEGTGQNPIDYILRLANILETDKNYL